VGDSGELVLVAGLLRNTWSTFHPVGVALAGGGTLVLKDDEACGDLRVTQRSIYAIGKREARGEKDTAK
jgi:hypothetical protein